ncbi:6-bladed beta-propeller [Rhodohalobacter mucosus]|nr:6-bladed beta-propeller [Rhodohalobacter mucosus]
MFFIFSCTNDNHNAQNDLILPGHIQELQNLKIISTEHQVPDTVELFREVNFESSEDVFLDGYINRIAIDDNERVYVGVSRMGQASVYVFRENGKFITKIGRYGRGPGEFENIRSMDIVNNKLFLFCSSLQKVSIYSIEDFSHIRDVVIRNVIENQSDSLINRLRVDRLFVTDDETVIVRLKTLAIYSGADERTMLYRKLKNDGYLESENLLKKERFKLYFPVNEGTDVPFTMPFTRSSLVTMTKGGHFFTNQTEEFLVKEYDGEGNYQRAFYYPMLNAPLNMRDFDLRKERQRAIDQYEMPESWPVVHTLEMDNKGRMWIASISENDSTYLWHLVNQQGEMLARFQLPGNRSSRNVMSEPLIRVHNNYFYTREVNQQDGIDRIVKHKIEFIER